MNQPVDPLASHPGEPQPTAAVDEDRSARSLSSQESLPERVFTDAHGVRLGWRIFLFFTLTFAIARLLGWIGSSFFPESGGAAHLWLEFYGELVALAGAVAAAFILSRVEKRTIDVYGLPPREAFGRWFWIGTLWGLAGITALLVLMHGAHVFDFGGVALHGRRISRFAAFWAVNFLVVALFEEFVFRGYFQSVLAERTGFWPAAIAGSAMFGSIHLLNQYETKIGALGAGLVGLFLCLTLRRTGSLWFAVGFHAAWDWGQTFVYGVPDSGTTDPGHLLSPRIHGNPWLTGGSVGPEASVLLLVVVAGLWLAFDRRYRRSPSAISPGPVAAHPVPDHQL